LSFLHLITFFHSSTFFQFKRFWKLCHFLLNSFRLPLTFCVKYFPFLLKYSLTYTFVFFKRFRQKFTTTSGTGYSIWIILVILKFLLVLWYFRFWRTNILLLIIIMIILRVKSLHGIFNFLHLAFITLIFIRFLLVFWLYFLLIHWDLIVVSIRIFLIFRRSIHNFWFMTKSFQFTFISYESIFILFLIRPIILECIFTLAILILSIDQVACSEFILLVSCLIVNHGCPSLSKLSTLILHLWIT
jgi:hypothetical protein